MNDSIGHSAVVNLFQPQIYRINDILGWHDRHELVLSPEFQRRQVWTRNGKSYLIDSIVKGMPIPQFFVRERIHARERRTVREVVDGQQRISAILEFIAGSFTILPSHNEALARTRYDSLPESIQEAILSYPLSVNIINTSDDGILLEIFSRLNAYSVPLNRAEKLNAQYTGAFKNSVHRIARRHHAFWQRHSILSNQSIVRMGDVDITGDLVVTMLNGLQNQKAKVESYYKKYDDDFPFAEIISDRFSQTLSWCEELVGVELSSTEFRRSALFYSLFCAVYESAWSFAEPPSEHRKHLNRAGLELANSNLQTISDEVFRKSPSPGLATFYDATLRSTDKLEQRRVRHGVLVEAITPAFE